MRLADSPLSYLQRRAARRAALAHAAAQYAADRRALELFRIALEKAQ